MIHGLHHVGVAVRSIDAALGFYRDVMGCPVLADAVLGDGGTRAAMLGLGEHAIELMQPLREDSGVARHLSARGESLHHVAFRTDDIDAELARLAASGVDLLDREARPSLSGRVAFLHPRGMHGVLVQLVQPEPGASDGGALPAGIRGIDHLATLVADDRAAREAWRRALGLEVVGEVPVPARQMLIAQVAAGRCMVELLSPTAPESPMAERLAQQGEGMSSMIALPVADIDAEIARYRAAGYTLPDAATGPLPNSVTSTITIDQVFGLAIQFIQFGRAS